MSNSLGSIIVEVKNRQQCVESNSDMADDRGN